MSTVVPQMKLRSVYFPLNEALTGIVLSLVKLKSVYFPLVRSAYHSFRLISEVISTLLTLLYCELVL